MVVAIVTVCMCRRIFQFRPTMLTKVDMRISIQIISTRFCYLSCSYQKSKKCFRIGFLKSSLGIFLVISLFLFSAFKRLIFITLCTCMLGVEEATIHEHITPWVSTPVSKGLSIWYLHTRTRQALFLFLVMWTARLVNYLCPMYISQSL